MCPDYAHLPAMIQRTRSRYFDGESSRKSAKSAFRPSGRGIMQMAETKITVIGIATMIQIVDHEKALTIGWISKDEIPYPAHAHPEANALPVPRTQVGKAS